MSLLRVTIKYSVKSKKLILGYKTVVNKRPKYFNFEFNNIKFKNIDVRVWRFILREYLRLRKDRSDNISIKIRYVNEKIGNKLKNSKDVLKDQVVNEVDYYLDRIEYMKMEKMKIGK